MDKQHTFLKLLSSLAIFTSQLVANILFFKLVVDATLSCFSRLTYDAKCNFLSTIQQLRRNKAEHLCYCWRDIASIATQLVKKNQFVIHTCVHLLFSRIIINSVSRAMHISLVSFRFFYSSALFYRERTFVTDH